jgi:hypothetical protein
MIFSYLYDIWPFLLLIFSPLETADFLMLLRLPGDGYSLLCSKKQPPRHMEKDGRMIKRGKQGALSTEEMIKGLEDEKGRETRNI